MKLITIKTIDRILQETSSEIENQRCDLVEYFDKHNYFWDGWCAIRKPGRNENGELYTPDEWTDEMEQAQKDLRGLERKDKAIEKAMDDFYSTDWRI